MQDISFEETQALVIPHPQTGQPLLNEQTGEPLTFIVYNQNSRKARRLQAHALKHKIAELNLDANSDVTEKRIADSLEHGDCEVLADCVTVMKHNEGMSIQGIALTKKNLAAVLFEAPWLRDVVKGGINAPFMVKAKPAPRKRSKKSS